MVIPNTAVVVGAVINGVMRPATSDATASGWTYPGPGISHLVSRHVKTLGLRYMWLLMEG